MHCVGSRSGDSARADGEESGREREAVDYDAGGECQCGCGCRAAEPGGAAGCEELFLVTRGDGIG